MKLKAIQPWDHAAKWREQKILPGFGKKSSPKIRKFFQQSMKSSWELANQNGIAEVLHIKQKPAAVFLFYTPKRAQVLGMKSIVLEYDPWHVDVAFAWLLKRLRAHRALYTSKTLLGLEPISFWDRALPEAGFRLHSEVMLGKTGIAYKKLMTRLNPPADLDHLGLEIRKIKTKAEVEKMIRLQKKVFTRIPLRGFFTHTESTLKRDRKEYFEAAKSKDSAIFGIWKEKRLFGFFGVFVRRDPTWGAGAGLTLTFDFPIQGKGIAKTAYRLALEHMKEKNVPTFRGGTSQPAVKGLAKIMGRTVQNNLWFWQA